MHDKRIIAYIPLTMPCMTKCYIYATQNHATQKQTHDLPSLKIYRKPKLLSI